MATSDISIGSPPGLVSILIPCCGMMEYTKLCVPSILQWTRPPYELIFLDIGSLDGTADYLAGLRDGLRHRMRVEICRADTDLEIKHVVREAIEKAAGEYLCLLNNDTVVTPEWLNALTGLAQYENKFGLVGPMSNYASPPQLVETVPYRVGPKRGAAPSDRLVDVDAVVRFSREFNAQNKGKWIALEQIQDGRLGGFCLLIRRQVLNEIRAALDEHSDLSLFDTDILSSKARQVGFGLGLCRDMFIHHFGTRTFAHGAPAAATEQRNGQQH
jgi:GT2 family glycosyltransferase